MEYFLRPQDAIADTKSPKIQDTTYLGTRDVVDAPAYAFRIDISMIANRGRSYKKEELSVMIDALFPDKTLPGTKKSDMVTFMLEPDNLARIRYNNELDVVEREK